MPSFPPIAQVSPITESQLEDLALLYDMARATALILIFRKDAGDPAINAITTPPANDQITRAESAAWRYVQQRSPVQITPELAALIIEKWEICSDPGEIIYPNEIKDVLIQSILNDVDDRRSTVAPAPPPAPPTPAVIVLDPPPDQPAIWLQPRLQF